MNGVSDRTAPMRRFAIGRRATTSPVSTARTAGSQGHAETLLTAVALLLLLVITFAESARPLPVGWTLLLIAAAWLPLTVRGRWPLIVLGVVAAVDTVDIAISAHPASTIVPVATMTALYTVATRRPAMVVWSAAAVAGAVQFGTALSSHPAGSDWLYLNWAVVAVVIGRLMRERRDRIAAADLRAEHAERTKQAEADRQVTAERIRIAHELHDVLAHHITVVNAQAGVAQYLLRRDPAAAESALAGITANSRAALEELRATLGLLRAEGDPAPSDRRAPAPTIDQLDGLLDGFSDAGMRLTVVTHGPVAALSGVAELAFYRIVQEALTNAMKHAPGGEVRLDTGWTPDSVQLTVTNTAASPSTVERASDGLINEGTGHGLIGMRERAAAAGGSISAGPTADGGYQVSATLPLPDSAERGPRPSAPPVRPAVTS